MSLTFNLTVVSWVHVSHTKNVKILKNIVLNSLFNSFCSHLQALLITQLFTALP